MEFKRPWYKVLEVSEGATEEQVKEAYRKAIMNNNFNDPTAHENAEKMAMEIIEAYKYWKEYVKSKKVYDNTEEGRRQKAIDDVLTKIGDDYVILYKVSLDYGYGSIRDYLVDAYNHNALHLVFVDIEKYKKVINKEKTNQSVSKSSGLSAFRERLNAQTNEFRKNSNRITLDHYLRTLKSYNNLGRVRNIGVLFGYNSEEDFLLHLISIDKIFIIEDYFSIDPDYKVDEYVYEYLREVVKTSTNIRSNSK